MNQFFAYEKDMIEPIISSITEYTQTNEIWFAFIECVSNSGIVDVVFAEFDFNAIEDRLRLGLGPVTETVQVRTLFATDIQQPRKAKEIAKTAGYSLNYVRKSLTYLAENGFLEKVGKGYIRNKGYKSVIKRLIAIEAKRENWIQGLYQARRYLRFANRVFLALDDAYKNRILPYEDRIAHQHIGISLVNANKNRAKISLMPDWNEPFSEADQVLIGERLWSVLHQQNQMNFGQLFSQEQRKSYLSNFSQISK